MTTTTELTVPERNALACERIRADIAAGTVPDTVASYSELHDHVDANYYPCTDAEWNNPNLLISDALIDQMNAVTNHVDGLIKGGMFRTSSPFDAAGD